MSKIEKQLERVVDFENSYTWFSAIFILFLTVFMVSGASDLEMSSDMKQQLPQHLDTMQLEDQVESEIGGSEGLIFVYQVDHGNTDFQNPYETDIRNPSTLESMQELTEDLENHPRIDNVQGPQEFFGPGHIPETLEGSKTVLSQSELTNQFFNDDYSGAYLFAETNFPATESDINEFNEDVEEIIDSTSTPSNVDLSVTGQAELRTEIAELLREDLTYTTGLAVAGLFALILTFKRSVKETFEVTTPLILAVLWLIGAAGHLGIPITITTVIVGPLVIGLGTEYGAFMTERYYEIKEENPDWSTSKILNKSVPLAGSSILGSATTATAGFLTLLVATIPMIRELGLLLGLGLIFCFALTVTTAPLTARFTEKTDEIFQNFISARYERF